MTDLTFEELAALLEQRGAKPYRARQIFEWVYQKQAASFDKMSNLPAELRHGLAEEFVVRGTKVVETAESHETKTTKYLIRLNDGETVETVVMWDRGRPTICVSTQVGCALGCVFCATGQSGFVRDLAPGEIVGQVLAVAETAEFGERKPNLVYMGMGEPMLNYDATAKSIRILMDPHGLGIGARKITVSTAGIVFGIDRFAQEEWQIRLSISLHTVDSQLRRKLMPVTRKYSLDALFDAVRRYSEATGRQVTFEYALIEHVNDSPSQARALAKTVLGIPCSVNLIQCNKSDDDKYKPATVKRAHAFRDALEQSGIRATLRRPRGRDIHAACGQLRRRTPTK
jgi:23S rRNA (adenine2503-C2)-methyltransferase